MSISACWTRRLVRELTSLVTRGAVASIGGACALSFIEDIHGLYYLCGLFPACACSWRRGAYVRMCD